MIVDKTGKAIFGIIEELYYQRGISKIMSSESDGMDEDTCLEAE